MIPTYELTLTTTRRGAPRLRIGTGPEAVVVEGAHVQRTIASLIIQGHLDWLDVTREERHAALEDEDDEI